MVTRCKIDMLEDSMRAGVADKTLEQTIFDGGTEEGDAQCKHYFGDGVYVRTMLIPKGTCVIGKIHKQARIVIITQGKCRFVDEFHEQVVEAGWIGEFKAGSKTAVFALEDTVWAACLGTLESDSITAFNSLVVGTHKEYRAFLEAQEKVKCLSEQ